MESEEQACLVSPSVEVTEAVGEAIGRRLGPGDLVVLSGDLGAGKTALVRGLARGLDVAEIPGSPSFALMNQYEGRCPLYHFDAWMRGREAALLGEGAGEYLEGDGVAVLEWGEQVASLLPAPRLEVRLGHLGPTERTLELVVIPSPEPPTTAVRERLRRLDAAREAARATAGLERVCGEDRL